jgi:hypothetical protein
VVSALRAGSGGLAGPDIYCTPGIGSGQVGGFARWQLPACPGAVALMLCARRLEGDSLLHAEGCGCATTIYGVAATMYMPLLLVGINVE